MLAAVDIGSSKICTLLANVGEDSIQILGEGIYPAKGIEKGLVADMELASNSIRQSINRAQEVSGEVIDWAYVGITGANISSQSGRSMVAVGRRPRLVKHEDVSRGLAAARDVDLPSGEKLLHLIPSRYTLDGQSGVIDPVGMRGFRLDVDSHMVTVPASVTDNLIKSTQKAGLKVRGFVLQSLACAYAALHPDEMNSGVVIADIGAGTTGIAAFKDNSLVLTSVLPIGGSSITQDLAIGLGLPFDLVETLKKQHADVSVRNVMSANGSDGSEEEDQEDRYISISYEGLSTIYKQDFNEIVRARVEEILKLIVSQLPSNHAYIAEFPTGLVLTGGTANIPGIASMAQAVTGLPARVATPSGLTGLDDPLYNPAYLSAVGLLLCKGRAGQDQSWIRDSMLTRAAGIMKNAKSFMPRVRIYRGF
jgi:cell division protein FtsA